MSFYFHNLRRIRRAVEEAGRDKVVDQLGDDAGSWILLNLSRVWP